MFYARSSISLKLVCSHVNIGASEFASSCLSNGRFNWFLEMVYTEIVYERQGSQETMHRYLELVVPFWSKNLYVSSVIFKLPNQIAWDFFWWIGSNFRPVSFCFTVSTQVYSIETLHRLPGRNVRKGRIFYSNGLTQCFSTKTSRFVL